MVIKEKKCKINGLLSGIISSRYTSSVHLCNEKYEGLFEMIKFNKGVLDHNWMT